MPKKYKVTLSDGRTLMITTEGGPPSETDVMGYLGQGQAQPSPAQSTEVPPPPESEGGMDTVGRFLKGLATPPYQAIRGAAEMVGTPPQTPLEGLAAIGGPVTLSMHRIGASVPAMGQNLLESMRRAGRARTQGPAATGGPVRQMAETAAGTVGEAMTGLPLIGPVLGQIQQRMRTGDEAGAAGEAISNVGMLGIGARGPRMAKAGRTAVTTKAAQESLAGQQEVTKIFGVTPKDVWFEADLHRVLPEIDAAVGLNKISSVRQFARVVDNEAAGIGAENRARYINPMAADPVPGTGQALVDATASVVSKGFKTKYPASARRILQTAERIKQSGEMTLGEAVDDLVATNRDLSTISKKELGGQRLEVADPEWGWLVKYRDALAEAIYQKVPEFKAPNQLQGAMGHIRDLAEVAATVADRTPRGKFGIQKWTALTPGEGSELAVAATTGRPAWAAAAGGRSWLRHIGAAKNPDVRFAEAIKKIQLGPRTPRPFTPQPITHRLVEPWDELTQMEAGLPGPKPAWQTAAAPESPMVGRRTPNTLRPPVQPGNIRRVHDLLVQLLMRRPR